MLCDNCGSIEPIEDQGVVSIRPASGELKLMIEENGFAMENAEDLCSVRYFSREELFALIQLMQRLAPADRQQMRFSVTGEKTRRKNWIPMPHFEKQMKHHDIVGIILEQQFMSYMQPIVDQREEIVAYEFLLRPIPGGRHFYPHELFETAHTTGLHSFLDRNARISAIEASALWLPKGMKRFVNFLPSSIYNPEFCLSHTLNTIDKHNLDPADFVFEVVETERVDNDVHLKSIFEVYRRNGIAVAMDDVGAGYSTIEQMNKLKPDYVKIDRSLVDRCDQDGSKQAQLSKIVSMASEFGACVLAEGIERREEFDFCRSIGIELGQGYLFGKPAERPPLNYEADQVLI